MPLVLIEVGEAECAVVDAEVRRRRKERDARAPAKFKMQYTEEELAEGRRIAQGDGPRATPETLAASKEYFARIRQERHALWKAGRDARPRASRVGVILEAIALGLPALAERSAAEKPRTRAARRRMEARPA